MLSMFYDAMEIEYIPVACMLLLSDRLCKVSHWLVFICQSLLGLVRSYLCIYVYKNINGIACTPSITQTFVPRVRIREEKKLLNVLLLLQNELKGQDSSVYM